MSESHYETTSERVVRKYADKYLVLNEDDESEEAERAFAFIVGEYYAGDIAAAANDLQVILDKQGAKPILRALEVIALEELYER